MFAVCGRWLEWDLEAAQDLFEDDGLVIAGFLTSTLAMFLPAIVIRTWDTAGHLKSQHGVWSSSSARFLDLPCASDP